MTRRGTIVAGGIAIAVLVALWMLLADRRSTSRRIQIPVNTMVARTDGERVDTVRWDGAAWVTVIPSNTITSMSSGGYTYQPTIRRLRPDRSLERIGVSVWYCTVDPEVLEACTPRAFVYQVQTGALSKLEDVESETPLHPELWLGANMLLVDFPDRGLYRKNITTGDLSSVDISEPYYTLSESDTRFSSDFDRVALSVGNSVKVWSFGMSQSVAVPGISTDYNTMDMAFSRDIPASKAKLAVVTLSTATMLGAGSLYVVDLESGSQHAIPGTLSHPYDFDPEWVDADRLVFLRAADMDLWATEDNGYSSDHVPAAVMLYRHSTGQVVELAPADAVRRALRPLGQGGVIAYMKHGSQGESKAYMMSIEGGGESVLIDDNMMHTDIAAPD